MQIKILSNTVVSGKSVKSGVVMEVDEINARLLIGMGRAEIFIAPKPKVKRRARKHDV